jgi:hypothetical protein
LASLSLGHVNLGARTVFQDDLGFFPVGGEFEVQPGGEVDMLGSRDHDECHAGADMTFLAFEVEEGEFMAAALRLVCWLGGRFRQAGAHPNLIWERLSGRFGVARDDRSIEIYRCHNPFVAPQCAQRRRPGQVTSTRRIPAKPVAHHFFMG